MFKNRYEPVSVRPRFVFTYKEILAMISMINDLDESEYLDAANRDVIRKCKSAIVAQKIILKVIQPS